MQGLDCGEGAMERLMEMPSHVLVCLGLALDTFNDVSYRWTRRDAFSQR